MRNLGWFGTFVIICLVLYVLSNPAEAGSNVRGLFNSGATFIDSLAG